MDKIATEADETFDLMLPISAVEQETGISKELLRMWERRYGFPIPQRDGAGNRLYSREQIQRLHQINRLLQAGFRPGYVVGAEPKQLERLLSELPKPSGPAPSVNPALELTWEAVRRTELRTVRQLLRRELARNGSENWILQLAAPLHQQMARARLDDSLPSYAQRAGQELLLETLELAAAQIPLASEESLRIFLMSLPGEDRPLELQMTRVLLLAKGVDLLFLGPEPPVEEVIPCLQHCPADVLQVAISAASINGANQVLLGQLRSKIPAHMSLWLSGSGAEELDKEGLGPRFRKLQSLLEAVESWIPQRQM